MANSIEEQIEGYYKEKLKDLGIRFYAKNEPINTQISTALANKVSKGGGSGMNYPDIKLLLENSTRRDIPVMIEAKGLRGKLEKLDKDGNIVGITKWASDGKPGKDGKPTHLKGDPNYNTIKGFAVNGAMHYGSAVLDGGYDEVIIVGVNGHELVDGHIVNPECKAYYVSKKNNFIPKLIPEITADDWSLFAHVDTLFERLDQLNLSEAEIEALTVKLDAALEDKIKRIHQSLYDDVQLKTALTTNEKLYLFCGLIMAGLKTSGIRTLVVDDLHSNDSNHNNDGTILLQNIESFLYAKNASPDKVQMISDLLRGVFAKPVLWKPKNGESLLKVLFAQVQVEIIPLLESNLHLDFTGRILNSLNDWVSIDNDAANDVVLTPRYVTQFMAQCARTNKDSFVWDKAMGSGGFLVSAMDLMIKDARDTIVNPEELEDKIAHIKENQLLGIEILGNIYILAVLNMILMGDGSSSVLQGNSHEYVLPENFPANVFLLNPPYSAPGKGFNFVEEAFNQMTHGYGAILIQDSAGNGQGNPYTKRILKNNTLEASIKMPAGLFGNKASVSVCIFIFKVGRPEDGYSRLNRKKSTQETNLRDVNDAKGHYEEAVAHVLGKKPKTSYYTEENGTVIHDTISLDGNDWLFVQHQQLDGIPTENDFKKVIADYLSWKISSLMKGGNANG